MMAPSAFSDIAKPSNDVSYLMRLGFHPMRN